MVDIPADARTTATFEGDPLEFASYSGELETIGDADWIRINLVSGQTYTFYGSAETIGPGGGDSYLRLFDSSGTLVAADDDGGVGLNSLMTFTAATTGTYYVQISAVGGDPGQYCIGVGASMPPDSQDSDGDDQAQLLGGSTVKLGGKGDDQYTNYDHVLGEQGDDTLTGSDAKDIMSGGLGNDSIFGGLGDDLLFGDAGGDRIEGGAGNDRIYGGDGGDLIFGGTGNNVIHGGNGADQIYGGDDVDKIFGDAGDDLLTGGSSGDTLDGGTGADVMNGGSGDDIYYVDSSGDIVDENGSSGLDKVYASVSFSLVASPHVKGDVENLVLTGSANINGTGNALANAITGNGGNNVLSGQDGNDTLNGRGGADKLSGGRGADHLTGGDGADVFIFTATTESTTAVTGRDTILDFSHAQSDKIDLHLIDAQTDVTGNQAFHFIGTAAFSHHSGELRYTTQSGNLYVYGDINGDGAADVSVQLNHLTSIQASDFLL